MILNYDLPEMDRQGNISKIWQLRLALPIMCIFWSTWTKRRSYANFNVPIYLCFRALSKVFRFPPLKRWPWEYRLLQQTLPVRANWSRMAGLAFLFVHPIPGP